MPSRIGVIGQSRIKMQIDRSSQSLIQQQNQNSNKSSFTLFQYCNVCKTGYRMERQSRLVQNTDINTLILNQNLDIESCSLGIYIDSMVMLGSETFNLIQPTVIVRVVDIETGYYKKCLTSGVFISLLLCFFS